MDAMNLFHWAIQPAMAEAIQVTLLVIALVALIDYLCGLSAKERWKIVKVLLAIFFFPLLVLWKMLTTRCCCGRCHRCGWCD
jgi:hypothetical protein